MRNIQLKLPAQLFETSNKNFLRQELVTNNNNMFSVLGHDETALIKKLDHCFESWGITEGAKSMIMPFMLPIQDLTKLDVYDNFPHQAMVATSLDTKKLSQKKLNSKPDQFHTEDLDPAKFALPSAACYSVYLHYSHQQLPENTLITILGKCCRKEARYENLRRLLGFHMREIVALGSQQFVEQHLVKFSEKIFAFTDLLELRIRKEAATDPFYDQNGSRTSMQKLSPVKYEFLFEDLSIASINTHRNFFGERCSINIKGSSMPIFTSCVAFGLERWLFALYQRYGNYSDAMNAVEKAVYELNAIYKNKQ